MSEAIPVIVLSAGKGTRVGTSKGLVLVDGTPWIVSQCARLANVGPVVVVVGNQVDEYLALVPRLGDAELAINPAPDRGQFSSLQVGARALFARGDFETIAVLPVDVPVPDLAVWHVLRAQTAVAAVPTYLGKGGHPVLLSGAFLRGMLEIEEGRLDEQLSGLPAGAVVRVPVADERVIWNLNGPAAFGKVGSPRFRTPS